MSPGRSCRWRWAPETLSKHPEDAPRLMRWTVVRMNLGGVEVVGAFFLFSFVFYFKKQHYNPNTHLRQRLGHES